VWLCQFPIIYHLCQLSSSYEQGWSEHSIFLGKLTGGLPSHSSWVRIFTGHHGERRQDIENKKVKRNKEKTEIQYTAARIPRQRRRHFNGVVIYIIWNIWKERNRRIFDNSSLDANQVAHRTKEDIELRSRALNNFA